MKKITIYTIVDKRPDFLPLQQASLQKHVRDEYELVVINNAIESKSRRIEIEQLCRKLGLRSLEVKRNRGLETIGGQKTFTWFGQYANPNVACSYPIKWAWSEMCSSNQDKIFVLIDSDMFLSQPLSFNEMLENYDAAFITHYRGPLNGRRQAEVTYIWNGICAFVPERIPALASINWDCGVAKQGHINGHAVDVGGYAHYWLQENKLRVRHVSEYAIYNYRLLGDGRINLECTLNGNYHFSFDYRRDSRETSNFRCYETGWGPGDAVLPHFPDDFLAVLQAKCIRYFETYIFEKKTYPDPTIFGFIELETFNTESAPFIFHIKGGSGYLGHSEDYKIKKLEFVKELLNL